MIVFLSNTDFDHYGYKKNYLMKYFDSFEIYRDIRDFSVLSFLSSLCFDCSAHEHSIYEMMCIKVVIYSIYLDTRKINYLVILIFDFSLNF